MISENTSPWLSQLKRSRPITKLAEDLDADVAVVGGGISGVATAYFLLRDTGVSVVLLERDEVASGATGHNGGQAVASFERIALELSEEFGEDLTRDGFRAIEGAWDLLQSMIEETGVDPGLQETATYIGLSSPEDLRVLLEEEMLKRRLGFPKRRLFLVEGLEGSIPEECRPLFEEVTREKLEEMLLTREGDYICAQENRAGLMNSALLCEGLVSWMLDRYQGRFRVYEKSPVDRIELLDGARLLSGSCSVGANHAVLCTNGYTDLAVEGSGGLEIPLKDAMRRVVGFLVGYLQKAEMSPVSTVYFLERKPGHDNDYFYLARRRYFRGPFNGLTNVGDPELVLGSGERYDPAEVAGAEKRYSRIDEFYKEKILGTSTSGRRDFSWNGLMGYTHNGVRMIGQDPDNPSLIYNLGCNGIGILPSIYGGKRVARLINGEALAPSIFDPEWNLKRTKVRARAARALRDSGP